LFDATEHTMTDQDRLVSAGKRAEDRLDYALRPARLDEMTGQARVVENLRILIEAAKGAARRLTTSCSTGRPAWARRPSRM